MLIERFNSFPLPEQQLEDANCADLPPHVYDKYFWEADPGGSRLLRATAKHICAHCAVLDECRRSALNLPNSQLPLTIGGESREAMRLAKSWHRFELGSRETEPTSPRPEWLPPVEPVQPAPELEAAS